MKAIPLKNLVLGVAAAALLPVLHAETIDQSISPAAGVDWNQPSVWGDNAVVDANDYRTTADLIAAQTAFVVNGTTWAYTANLRDAESSSTFGGNSLILSADTRLLGKALGEATSTANIVLNGGFIHSAPNAGGSSTLAGTLSFAPGVTLGAIGMLANGAGAFTFNVASTIVGGSDVVLQLSMDGATRTNHLNITGDISGFLGTIYVSTAADGVGSDSSFSIASSAPEATLELATASTNFRFDLNSQLTFKSVVIAGEALPAGTYTYDDLNDLAPGSFLPNGGSLTVVPEPSVLGLSIAAVGWLLLRHAPIRRRRAPPTV